MKNKSRPAAPVIDAGVDRRWQLILDGLDTLSEFEYADIAQGLSASSIVTRTKQHVESLLLEATPPPSKQPATDAVLNAWKIIEQQIAHSINPINREPEFEDLCFAKSVVRAALSAEKLDAEALKREIVPWVSTRIPKKRTINRIEVCDWIELFIDHLKAAHPQLFKGE